MRRRFPAAAQLATALLLCPVLAACGSGGPKAPAPEETEVPEELKTQARPPARPAGEDQIGTPMEDRVATIGLLNKRNNLSQDITLKPGESRRIGNAVIRLAACERTAPWEMPAETGAFVQLLVRDAGDDGAWRKIFSGWLFKESPSLNVVEHPIYDVWVKDCAMRFPGDDAPAAEGAAAPAPRAAPPAAASPAPVASPSPAAAPTNEA